jgi:hypothetical protein
MCLICVQDCLTTLRLLLLLLSSSMPTHRTSHLTKKTKTNTRRTKSPTGRRKNAKVYLWYFPGLYNTLCKQINTRLLIVIIYSLLFTHSRNLLMSRF